MKKIFFLTTLVLVFLNAQAQVESTIPHLKKQGNSAQLIVNGKPIILLSAELTNSAGSSMAYMEPIWPLLKRLHLNSVLSPISWEMIEPEEGKFDFSSLDEMVFKARGKDMKLVILWFGTWKNAVSSYAPEWVRKDLKRFPRWQTPEGENTRALSCFVEANWLADAKALAATMKHLKEIDGIANTVVAVQVENESGVKNFPRDYSQLGEKYFKSKVPETLISFLKKKKDILIPEFDAIWGKSNYKSDGTWTELFGDDADEIFMAWNIASYIDKVAAAGKKEYPIPMYANAWLDAANNKAKPGDYPSGGPIAKMLPVYQAAAPHLDFLSPDIYRTDFDTVFDSFKRMGNLLFIPETRVIATMTANVFYAVGEGALCFSPFGIDNRLVPKDTLALANSYRIISNLMPIITQYQGTGKMKGILIPSGETKTMELGDYQISFSVVKGREIPAFGLIIAKENNEFLIAGDGFSVKFISKSKSLPHAEVLWAYEMIYKNDQWINQRRWNGDETLHNSELLFVNRELQYLVNEPRIMTAKIFCYE